MTSIGSAERMVVRRGTNFNVAHFSDTMNIINVGLCMMVLTGLYLFIALARQENFIDLITENLKCLPLVKSENLRQRDE